MVLTLTGFVVSALSFLSDLANATWSAIHIIPPGDLFAGFASMAVGTMILKEERRIWALASIIILCTIPNYLLFARILNPYMVILGGIIGYVVLRRTTWRKKDCLLWLLVVFIMWSVVFASTLSTTITFASVEPTGNNWRFDPVASLKMFYLMKKGTGYYEAYLTAITLNEGVDPAPVLAAVRSPDYHVGYIPDFRGPFLFYLWMILPNGSYIYAVYIAWLRLPSSAHTGCSAECRKKQGSLQQQF